MSTKRIETLIYDIYQNEGVGAACKEANKHMSVKYEFCNMCDTSVPTIKGDHGCLFCGHETMKDDLDFEDIPLEND